MINIFKNKINNNNTVEEHVVINNENGMSLLELLVGIVVGSIITIILMQILVMTVAAKAQLDQENKMLDGTYVLAEQLRQNIFELQPQKIENIPNGNADLTVIHITHEYDITTNASNIIVRDYSNPFTDILTLDMTDPNDTKITYYNDELNTTTQLNDSSLLFRTGTSIDLISIEPSVCDLSATSCEQGIIKLTMSISIVLKNGTVLEPQTFITTILV